MATIRRLTHSCVIVTTDDHATLFDPDFFSFTSGAVDLDSIGDVSRVFVTHEHADHLHPDFLRWLIDRRRDLTVHSNDAVSELLTGEGIDVSVEVPEGVSVEDVAHERIPNGATPPNRAWTIDGVFTHPGDSLQPTSTAPVLSLAFMAPWGSSTKLVDFAKRLRPRQVIPGHDFYLSERGREFVSKIISGPLSDAGIELVALGWGESYSV